MLLRPVIICGGSGTRLWPLSRAGFPKQFLVLSGNQSLFQQAVQRVATLGDERAELRPAPPLVVCNEEHRFLVLEQLRELGQRDAHLLLEPMGRNTAPAVTLAALQAQESDGDAILVVVPADQTVTDAAAFQSALQKAALAAAAGSIVVLGITPDRPETGYGYIRASGAGGQHGQLTVAEFVEKPDLETAGRYLADGHYSWNGGIFVLKASIWLAAMAKFRPDILEATRKAWEVRSVDAAFIRPGKEAFAAVPADSVDYAVMENSPGSEFAVEMVPLAAGWSDLGAWDAVWQVAEKDAQGNALTGDVVLSDCEHSLVHAGSRMVGVVGLRGVVVVETADAVLVADKSRSQEVKRIVAHLQAHKRSEHELHRLVHRPWGWYDSIDQGERFKVKRIMVKPKASLSLQMHHHRAEHWIVVKGTAEITCGDKKVLLTENQSTYIPLGETHRLANPGTIPLEIIEVQSGSYLGEDDIVRFEDTYGRTAKQ
jgi:mannose-1-phosphate guanylyltransferase / mannose-6-phosphate isomerase